MYLQLCRNRDLKNSTVSHRVRNSFVTHIFSIFRIYLNTSKTCMMQVMPLNILPIYSIFSLSYSKHYHSKSYTNFKVNSAANFHFIDSFPELIMFHPIRLLNIYGDTTTGTTIHWLRSTTASCRKGGC